VNECEGLCVTCKNEFASNGSCAGMRQRPFVVSSLLVLFIATLSGMFRTQAQPLPVATPSLFGPFLFATVIGILLLILFLLLW